MLRCSSSDAAYAWRKMDGIPVDGRKWKVDYATKVCFHWWCCMHEGTQVAMSKRMSHFVVLGQE